jgi:ribosomal-protein-alanine N-acetyltransferase
MIPVLCRSVHEADLPGVIALDHLCFDGLWSEDAYRREIASPNSDLLLLETAYKSQVAHPRSPLPPMGLACSWAILDEAHITLLGIHPDYRGRGLGRWLLLMLLKTARHRGLTRATLEVRQSNQAAQKLYLQYGFQIAGERRNYYNNGESALILWLSGIQTPDFETMLSAQHERLTQQLLTHQIEITVRGFPS